MRKAWPVISGLSAQELLTWRSLFGEWPQGADRIALATAKLKLAAWLRERTAEKAERTWKEQVELMVA